MCRVLTAQPLTYCGKISYGIYVYHPFMPQLCKQIFSVIGLAYPESPISTFLIPTIATLTIASLSWYVLEKPLNDLKRFFTYKPISPAEALPEGA